MSQRPAFAPTDHHFMALAAPLAERVGWNGVAAIADSTLRIAGDHLPTYVGLMQMSKGLIDEMLAHTDLDTVLEIYRLAGRIGGELPEQALQLLKTGPAFVKALARHGEVSPIAVLLDLAHALAAEKPLLACRFLSSSPQLLAPPLTMEAISHLARCLLAAPSETQLSAIQLLIMAPGVIVRLPVDTPKGVIDELHALVVRTMAHSAPLAGMLYEQSPRLISTMGLSGVREVVRLSVDVGREGWAAGQAFFGAAGDLVERVGFQGLARAAGAARAIAAHCPQTAVIFMQRSAAVLDRVGAEGLWAFARFCTDMAASGTGMAVRFPEQSLRLMDRLLQRGDRRTVRQVYDLAGRTGQVNPMLAHKLLEKSPELMDRIGLAGLDDFSRVVLNLARDSWTTADALIKSAPEIIDRMGYAHIAQMAALSLKIAGKNAYGAVSLLDKSPAILDRLLPVGGRPLCAEVFALADELADAHWAVALRMLERSPDIIACSDIAGLTQITGRCLKLAARNEALAKALLDISAQVVEKSDVATLLQVADFWATAAPSIGPGAVAKLTAWLARIDALIAMGGPDMPARVHRLALEVGRHNGQAALNLLNHSIEHLEMAGSGGLARIAAQTMLLSRLDPLQAARFAAGEGIAFADFSKNIPQGLHLRTVQPILYNYLAALLGYRLEIAPGAHPAIDARQITLPEKVREFDSDEHNFVYYKVMATRLEAHLEYGGFDLQGARTQALYEAARHTFGVMVPESDNRLTDFLHLFPEPRLAEELVHILENFRLDQCLEKAYPALRDAMRMVDRHDLKKRVAPDRIGNGKQRVLERIWRLLTTQESSAQAPEPDQHLLRQARQWAAVLADEATTFHNSLEAAVAIYLQLAAAFKEPFEPVLASLKRIDPDQTRREIGSFGKTANHLMQRLNQEDGRQSAGADGVESSGKASPAPGAHARRAPRRNRVPNAQNSASGRPAAVESDTETEDNRQARHSSEQQGATGSSNAMTFDAGHIEQTLRRLFKEKGITPNAVEQQTRRMRPEQIGIFLSKAGEPVLAAGPLEAEKGTVRYPEWDETRSAYRNDWSRIREQPAPAGDPAFYAQTLTRHAGLLKRVRREFERLRPEVLARMTRMPDGEEIDLDAAIESVIDRKVGLTPSENVYQHNEKKLRDIAVAILVDMSKSTRGDTLRFEKEALVILSEALHVVGDAYAIYGFSGDNRDNVDFYRIKDFKESNNHMVRQRIAGIACGLENRDGAALRHVAGILKSREEKTRLIVLLSDGKPVDKAYAGRYAIEDTRKALLEAQLSGIKTFCITIDQQAPEYLPRMYRHSSWVVIDDVARLPEKISRIFARLTQ
jgi:nitric oxide reductase NorD protein